MQGALPTMLRCVATAAVAVSTVACEDNLAPPFPEGQGQAADPGSPYPAGPYGVTVGAVIQNFGFIGFSNPEEDATEKQAMELADFWNPTGEDTFPGGSIFGEGQPKPTALVVIVSAV